MSPSTSWSTSARCSPSPRWSLPSKNMILTKERRHLTALNLSSIKCRYRSWQVISILTTTKRQTQIPLKDLTHTDLCRIIWKGKAHHRDQRAQNRSRNLCAKIWSDHRLQMWNRHSNHLHSIMPDRFKMMRTLTLWTNSNLIQRSWQLRRSLQSS
jgi:hypothetical protein